VSWPLTNTIVTVVRPRRAFQNDTSNDGLSVLAGISDSSGLNGMGLEMDLWAAAYTKVNGGQEGVLTALFDDMNWLDYFLGNGSRRTFAVSFENHGCSVVPWFDGIQGRLSTTGPAVAPTYSVTATSLPMLTIGCKLGGTNYFKGSVKAVLIFNRVLTSADFDYVGKTRSWPWRSVTLEAADDLGWGFFRHSSSAV